MKIGVIGDDFTGSGDIANTLTKAGARTIQYLGIPPGAASEGIDAAVVSLKTRSLPAAMAVDQALTACRWLVDQGARQIVFKYCSTFDSTPHGNIGPVAEALLAELRAPFALVCPAFPANGRTVYQGHLFVRDRLLSESGMEKHPLTPMTDPDIRRWLRQQTGLEVGHVPLSELRLDPFGAIRNAAASGGRLLVADSISDADLLLLGKAAAEHRLVTGGSGIAMGLPANFGLVPSPRALDSVGVDGPALVLAGSCSAATLRQVEAYRSRHPSLLLDATIAMEENLAGLGEFLQANRGKAPLIYSTLPPEEVASAQARYGRDRLAQAFERAFAAVARSAIGCGFSRIVVAGGEISGAVAGILGSAALDIGPEIAPGVPAIKLRGERNLALALKSGNFGGDDFFAEAVHALGGAGRVA